MEELIAVFESAGLDAETSQKLATNINQVLAEKDSALKDIQESTEQSKTLIDALVQENEMLHKEMSIIQEQYQTEKESLVQFTLDKVREEKLEEMESLVQFTLDKVQEEKLEEMESLVQFTLDKVQEDTDVMINNMLVKIAEEFVSENEEQLELVAEDTAVKLIGATIAESLSLAGVELQAQDEELYGKINELEEELSSYKRQNKLYQEAINDIHKHMLIEESASDMSELQKERFTRLAKNIPYNDKNSFEMGLKYLQESIDSTKASKPVVGKPQFSFVSEGEEVSIPAKKTTPTFNSDIVAATLAAMRR